jgi:hypothetical protein
MEISHIISETVLAIAGFFSFYVYLRKLPIIDRILLGTFILLVALAALFAALRFVGISEMILPNLYVKQIAATTGVLYLIIGVYSLVANKQLSKEVIYGILIIGFIVSIVFIIFKFEKIINLIPTIGIPILFFLGIWAVRKGKSKIGSYLLLGTLFSILANFIHLLNLPFNRIDTYCLLLASALICFGLAGKNTSQLGQINNHNPVS